MNEQELLSAISAEEKQALGFFSGDLSSERERALEYYNGKLDVAAQDGRSDVVSTDVRDAVDGMLPDLLDVFLSSDELVKFEPQGPEDEQPAKQASDFCNYVFYRQNPGALILYEWFKTALLEKNGVVKYYWDKYATPVIESYEKLSDAEFQMLVASEKIEVLEHSQTPAPQQAPQGAPSQQTPMAEGVQAAMPPQAFLHDVKIRVASDGKICIEGMPSEEFLICADHRSLSLENVRFCEHRRQLTISQIRAMGYDVPDDLAGDEDTTQFSPEWSARRRYAEEQSQFDKTTDKASRRITVSDISMLVDFDGDGMAERRHIVKAGSTILANEDSDHVPFAAICPNVMPYRFYGLSVADLVADIQKLKSIVWRYSLDSLYQSVVPRIGVMENMVNLDDLLVARPGGIVRFKTNPAMAMQQIETKFVGQQAFPMIEYMDSVKENRTGFTRYSQGLDSDSLNKTATGIGIITQSSAKRLKLVARMFAETGMKDLFKGILHLTTKYDNKPKIMRLRNTWVPVDPRQWKTGWDMTVNIGLGTGDKTQQAAHLQQIMQIQGGMRESGMTHVANDMNIYNAAKRVAETAGFKQEGEFFTPPGPQNPAPQPPPPPEAIKAQTEQAKLQSDQQIKQMELQQGQSIAQIQSQTNIAVAQIKSETDKFIAQMQAEHQRQLEQMRCRHEAEMGAFKAQNERAARSEQGAKLDTGYEVQEKDGKQLIVKRGVLEEEEMTKQQLEELKQMTQAMAEMVKAVVQSQSVPKMVVRDAQGQIVGVKPMTH